MVRIYGPEHAVDLSATLAKFRMIYREQLSETITHESIFNSNNSNSSVFSFLSTLRVENKQKLLVMFA